MKTVTQLLWQHDRILALILNGENVDIVYLDFEKVFDKVDHGLLLNKMRELGIGGQLDAWIGKFLTER